MPILGEQSIKFRIKDDVLRNILLNSLKKLFIGAYANLTDVQ